MIRKFLKCIPILLVTACSFQAAEVSAITWDYNFYNALQKAKSQNKPILVDFYTDWCGWCKKLDRDTYSDKRVNELALQFVCVKVDGDKNADLLRKYNVRGFPYTLFLASDGKVVDMIRGYAGPTDFIKKMEQVLKTTGGSKRDKKPDKQTFGQKTELDLSGIIYSPDDPRAIINNDIVRIGDTVGGSEVTDITEEKVTLSDGEKETVLEL